VLGTLNNCGAGQTPWGTYITCEENFNGYFGTEAPNWTASAEQLRYGIGAPDAITLKPTGFGYGWHKGDSRFDLAVTPNEPNRHGWVVEIDPYSPSSTPKKRTALGRFKHENAECVLSKANKAVVYTGCDERGEYLYKFVSTGTYDAANKVSGANLLDSGILHVAKFDACTNNNRRGTNTASTNKLNGSTTAGTARPPLDEANPRAVNNWGHVIRINEMGADAAALTFNWDIFVIAGNPSLDGAKKGSSNIDATNTFNSPDGIQVDPEGRLWIQTDGQYSNTGDYANQGNNQMLVADITTKKITRFLVGPAGCEVTGVCWTPDGRTMFINIQHPGEVGSHPNAPADYKTAPSGDAWINANPTAFSKWPDGPTGGRPRSGTVVIRKNDGGVIGT
jgi:secreted PhoX family phosphatase